jgi:tape measure domain-containing protein
MAVDILNLGFRVDTAPVKSASKDLDNLGSSAKKAGSSLTDMGSNAEKASSGTTSLASSIKGLVAGYALLAGVASLAKTADEFTKFTVQLKIATKSQVEFNQAYQNVINISKIAQADVNAIGNTYARLARSLDTLGASQTQIGNIVEVVALGLKTGGATATETASAMLQLSQAFGKGTLNGDEFNSMAENAPPLMRLLADSLGVSIGALKKMGSEGKITADIMANAFNSPAALAMLREQASQITTISGAYQVFKNELSIAIGEMDKATGISKSLAGGITTLANNLNILIPLIGALSTALLALFSESIIAGFVRLAAGARALAALFAGPVGLVALAVSAGLAYLTFGNQASDALEKARKKAKELNDERSQDPLVKNSRNPYGDVNKAVNEQTQLRIKLLEKEESIKARIAFAERTVANKGQLPQLNEDLVKVQNEIKGSEGLLADYAKQIQEIAKSGEALKPAPKSFAELTAELKIGSVQQKEFLELSKQITDAGLREGKTHKEVADAIEAQRVKIFGSKKAKIEDNTSAKQLAETYAKLAKEIIDLNNPIDSQTDKIRALLATIANVDPAFQKWALGELSANDALSEMNRSIDANQKAMAEQRDEIIKQDDAYNTLHDKLQKANEDLNVSIINDDKKRAKAQVDLEHERTIEVIRSMDLEEARRQELMDLEQRNYELTTKGLGQSKNMAKELGLTFTSAFEDAIAGGKKLSTVLKSLLQDVLKLVTRQLITNPLMNVISGALGDLIPSFMGSAGGGYTPLPDFVPAYAGATPNANGNIMTSSGAMPLNTYSTGGIATQPQLAVFGEGRMNEAYVPLPDGRSIPVSMKGGGGANVEIVINNNSNSTATASESTDSRGKRRIEVTIGDLVAGEIKRNGSQANTAIRSTFATSPVLVGR